MVEGIRAVAFDIDGTLYSEKVFNRKIVFYYIKHLKFFIAFGTARKELHRKAAENPPLNDKNNDENRSFFAEQAEIVGKKLGITTEQAESAIQKTVYEGMKPFYAKTPAFKDAVEVIHEIKASGMKVAILSDYPPEQKGTVWGLTSICDAVVSAEKCGILKPSPVSFKKLADELNLLPSQILYVGNSRKYDVAGSRAAGMKSAWLLKGWRKLFNKPWKGADFCFRDYRQLRKIVLQ